MIEIFDKARAYPRVLLAGDVPYESMPGIFNLPVSFLHVPHHCSNMELKKLQGLPRKSAYCAIISTNHKMDKSKKLILDCDILHYGELSNKFVEVHTTVEHNPVNDFENLSFQIKYVSKTFQRRPL